MRMFLIIASLLFWPLQPYVLGSEIPKPLKGAKVQVEVASEGLEIYSYSYTITNSSESEGKVSSFDIDITRSPNGLKLTSEGLTNGPLFIERDLEEKIKFFNMDIIPVGVFTPEAWIAGISGPQQTVGWSSSSFVKGVIVSGRPNVISPGFSKGGFKLMSHGLPGIREYFVQPFIDIRELPSDIAPKSVQESIAFDKAISLFGKTIGPTAPPAQFVALDFLNYLIDLKHQAGTLGWVTNPGVQDSLDLKLDQAKKKLEAGDTKTASNILQAFLNEVNAQGCQNYSSCPSGKHLLPEAWALLKFNAQFLLGKL